MRIAFFGLPLAALLLARDGHDVARATICRPGAFGLRRLGRAIGDGRVRVLGRREADAGAVREVLRLDYDLVVSWFWTRRLPAEVVARARLGGLGVHPSLLPRHRGPDPYFWAIDAGDPETGVTAHRLAPEYDTGAVLGRRALRIEPSWNAWHLARALDRPSLALLRDLVRRMARGETLVEEPQDDARATWAPEPDDETCAVRWSWPTDRILRRVRALAPAPGAWTEIDGRVVTVLRARAATVFPAVLAPGEAAVVASGGAASAAVVRTGDGAVELIEGEIDGAPAGREALAALVRATAERARTG